MTIDWWTLALQAINVLVLIWLLSRFLYRPVLAAIAARQAAADKLLADAEAAKAKAQAEGAAFEAQRAALTATVEQQRKAVLDAAELSAQTLLKQAEDEASAHAAQVETALARERQVAAEALRAQAAELATTIAGTLLSRLPPQVVTEALFQSLLAKIAALPATERQRIDAPQILTATALSDVEQASYRERLADALGHPLDVHFTVEAALIAGFELCGTDILVTNSWRADLAAVLRQLSEAEHG
ncbi:MAG: H(+)-transporting ATPase [Pseudomonadales bacterium]|jgi:F-type H+-transporting ATPase subunit b|nr:H(+)-transporting ATPase [Pseudomonadales bacterium]